MKRKRVGETVSADWTTTQSSASRGGRSNGISGVDGLRNNKQAKWLMLRDRVEMRERREGTRENKMEEASTIIRLVEKKDRN